MTHLHFDHASGMSEFPGATFVVTEAEWIVGDLHRAPSCAATARPTTTTPSTTGRSATTARVCSYSTFGRTFDLFGDGSVRLASPRHSANHQSVICRLATATW